MPGRRRPGPRGFPVRCGLYGPAHALSSPLRVACLVVGIGRATTLAGHVGSAIVEGIGGRPSERHEATAGRWLRRSVLIACATALVGCTTDDDAPSVSSARAFGREKFDIRDFGAAGDGTSDDTRAINAAISAANRSGGGDVMIPRTTTGFLCGDLTLTSGVHLVGTGPGSRLVARDGVGTWIRSVRGAQDIAILGLTLAGSGRGVTTILRLDRATHHATVSECTIIGNARAGSIGLATRGECRDVHVEKCTFRRTGTGVRISSSTSIISIARCRFESWVQRGIYVVAKGWKAASHVDIGRNVLLPQADGGSVRHPIQFVSASSGRFRDVSIVSNRVVGANTAYVDRQHPGTADLISLHACRDFVVRGNTCLDGGDMGITVSQQCIHGVVEENSCRHNDAAGICIGSGHSRYVRDIIVRNNTCRDNGMDRADRLRDHSRCGIKVTVAFDVTIVGNTIISRAKTAVDTFGIAVTDTSDPLIERNSMVGIDEASHILRDPPWR